MAKLITSKDNQYYKELLKLKKGDAKEGLFLAEGKDMFDEAKKAGCLVKSIVSESLSSSFDGAVILKDSLFRELSSYQSLPEVISICKKEYSKEFGSRVIYLDGVQDPGNCGTIIRTALSFGYSSVVLSKDSVSFYNNKVIQSTKGALFHLPIAREDLTTFPSLGYHLYLTTLDGEDERNLTHLEEPFCLVFGNEGTGIRKEHLSLGKKIKIEMDNIDSLNIAIAAGIFMYRFQRR